MFGVASLFYLYEFLLRVSPSVLEGEWFVAFHMDARDFGFFASCWYWIYAPLQLPVGALTDKYGPRRLLSGAILLCASGALVCAFTHSFFISVLARCCIGAGSAFAFISCLKIANIWFHPRYFALLTGLTLTIGTLGAASGGMPLAFALNYMSWRTLFIYLGLLGIGLSILAFCCIRDRNLDHPEFAQVALERPAFWESLWVVVKTPQIWLVGGYAFFITAPTDAFGGAWGVKFLMDVHGISRNAASVIAVTMPFLGMALGSTVIGWFSGKINNRKLPMAISSAMACIALLLIIYLPYLSIWNAGFFFFAFGFFASYVLAFVMARREIHSAYVATAVGFVNMTSMLGSALLTYFIGYFLDGLRKGAVQSNGMPFYSVSDYHVSLFILPLFYAISAFLIVPFIRDRK